MAALLVCVGAPFAGQEARAQMSAEDCALCHSGDDSQVPAVTDSMAALSVHGGASCLDCHGGITELPHADDLPAVECGACHSDQVEIYRAHGRGRVGVTPDLPGCADCHGSHAILPIADPLSSVHPSQLPTVCGRCHQDVDLVRKHKIRGQEPVAVYRASVHGQAASGGRVVAASCVDCHSAGGTAHRILPPGDPQSSINHFNIPRTCGACHANVEQDYWEGIHGQLTMRGETDTPVCTHCHGEHRILRADDPRSPVSPVQVATATCTPCHEAASLNEEFDIPAGRLASFVDSYHGLKSRSGDLTVANCASCHGAHRILPGTDPGSRVHQDNLQATCGECHPGISAQLARTEIHTGGAGMERGWSRFFAVFYTVIIVGVIGGMVAHNALDWRRRTREVLAMPQVSRMSRNARLQHWALAVSFTVLAVSGFALRYSETGLFHVIFGWDGGARARGVIHRSSAVAFVLLCLWHLAFLRSREGRRFWQDMLPGREDLRHVVQKARHDLGKVAHPPRFGRFTYMEKTEYWALLWGSVIMIGTGLLLWVDNFVVRFVPEGLLNIMLVIHFYEAWLAALAVLVWHLYATVFNPKVYPGNPAWVTGTMPRDWYEEEHPASAEAPHVEKSETSESETPRISIDREGEISS